DLLAGLEPARRQRPGGPGDGDAPEAEPEGRASVVRDTAMPLALVGAGDARGEDRRPAERARGVRGLRGGNAAVAEAGTRSDDARPDTADDGVETGCGRPGERRRGRDAGDVAVEARADRHRRLQQPARLQGPDRVRERDRAG